MSSSLPFVSLGFTDEKFPAGTHICQIYSDERERDESLLQFIRSGLEAGEHIACFSDQLNSQMLSDYLDEHGISISSEQATGALTLAATNEIYFENNKFDPERMLALLTEFENESKSAGCSACRVIGEMSPIIEEIEGGSRLMEYESRVSLLLKTHPVTAVCQYNTHDFNGATIMDVLKVHPLMIVRGSVMRNPFFIPPEKILKG